MASHTQKIGLFIEQEALLYLQSQGLKFIDANFVCKSGEIDLIMRDNEVYVFVEVRYRKISEFGDGAESVTKTKQSKIIRASRVYLQEKNLCDKVLCRFDVIAASDDGQKEILWVKDAFWPK